MRHEASNPMKSALLVLLLLHTAPPQDEAKGLKEKEVALRLAAVELLSRDADPKAERALHSALKDEDWEVVERAAIALAEHGGAASVEPLVKLALEAPVARIRRAAARTLGKIAQKPAAEHLLRKLSGEDTQRACEALALVLRKSPQGSGGSAGTPSLDLKPLEKLALKNKNRAVQAAAARAWVAGADKDRPQVLEKVLEVPSVAVGCAALEACAEEPRPDLDPVLQKLLSRPALSDLSERRALAALRASLWEQAEDPARAAQALGLLKPLLVSKDGVASARGARLVGMLATRAPEPAVEKPEPPLKPRFDPAALLALLRPALAHPDEAARAAAVKALARIGGVEAADAAREIGAGDKKARVRFQAIGVVSVLRGPEEGVVAFLSGRLFTDPDAEVRAEAAVGLGKKGSAAAVEPLVRALSDRAWEVAACAAVSLGKTQSTTAVEPLAKLARESADWKLRGAALAGLASLYQRSAIPALMPALADPDPCVARSALAYLVAITREHLPPKVEVWREWWEKNGEHVLLVDPETEAQMRHRFSDAQTAPAQVYRDLDLVVLESRGDHIEKLLDKQKIEHRMTLAGKVGENGIQPDTLFVANCTGEIESVDVERLRWFVLCGGRLFGSCWALHETIEKVVPGVVRKFETRDEVDDNVSAEEASAGSPYSEGVFASEVRPIYALEGAHLIEVLDPERVEVLVDSPACADSWGSGDLAAWFRAGHGLVLDSVNHFEAQGLEMAPGLKTRRDRQAYAVDHMGLTYASLRAGKEDKVWDNSLRASEKVLDLSVFRLVTNFVRRWRLEVGR